MAAGDGFGGGVMQMSGSLNPDVLVALTRTTEVKKEMRKVANDIRKRARANARQFRQTGNLERNIVVENVLDDKGQVEFRVGWSTRAWYGWMVEAGTEDTPARPHLRPAADAVRHG